MHIATPLYIYLGGYVVQVNPLLNVYLVIANRLWEQTFYHIDWVTSHLAV